MPDNICSITSASSIMEKSHCEKTRPETELNKKDQGDLSQVLDDHTDQGLFFLCDFSPKLEELMPSVLESG